jgi:hypothetical protein
MYGYAFQVDIWVPPEKHSEIDFAPSARVTVGVEDLSEEQQRIAEILHPVMGERMAPSLGLQKNRFLDVSVLQLYQKIGVEFLIKEVWR